MWERALGAPTTDYHLSERGNDGVAARLDHQRRLLVEARRAVPRRPLRPVRPVGVRAVVSASAVVSARARARARARAWLWLWLRLGVRGAVERGVEQRGRGLDRAIR